MNSFTLPRFPALGAASTPPSTLRIRVTSAGTTHDFSQRRIQFFPISFSLYVEKLTISISLDHNGKLYLFFHTWKMFFKPWFDFHRASVILDDSLITQRQMEIQFGVKQIQRGHSRSRIHNRYFRYFGIKLKSIFGIKLKNQWFSLKKSMIFIENPWFSSKKHDFHGKIQNFHWKSMISMIFIEKIEDFHRKFMIFIEKSCFSLKKQCFSSKFCLQKDRWRTRVLGCKILISTKNPWFSSKHPWFFRFREKVMFVNEKNLCFWLKI